jgi:hypothetical protein
MIFIDINNSISIILIVIKLINLICSEGGNFMRIAIVGGLDRNESHLVKMAAESGHTVEGHTGHAGGKGARELKRLIDKSSFVIIQFTVNSHGGVQIAKRFARQKKIPSVIVPRLGKKSFQVFLENLKRFQGISFYQYPLENFINSEAAVR